MRLIPLDAAAASTESAGRAIDIAPVAVRLAQALRDAGVGRGHRVGAVTGNTLLHVALHAASRDVGCSLVPLPPTVPDDGLERRLQEASVDAVVIDASAGGVPPARIPLIAANADGAIVGASGRVARSTDGITEDSTVGSAGPTRPEADKASTASVWVRTSGTTGAPRLVELSLDMLRAHADAAAQRLDCGPSSVWLAVLPLRHVGGVALVDRCLRQGSTLVLASRFDAAAVAQGLETHGVTHVSLVPTMLHRLVELGARPPASLRCVLLGGDLADEGLLERASALGWPVWCTYGLTEASSQVATATPEERAAFPGTSGRPLTGIEVTVARGNGERSAGPTVGLEGELIVTGTSVVGGGPLATGDLGHLDAEGRVYVTGRVRDVIVSGGEKILATDVEAVLDRHPDVAASCVVGLPDAEWGSKVAAAVILRSAKSSHAASPTAQQQHALEAALTDHCRKALPSHAVPKAWKLVTVLPRTESGKLQRALVRERWTRPD